MKGCCVFVEDACAKMKDICALGWDVYAWGKVGDAWPRDDYVWLRDAYVGAKGWYNWLIYRHLKNFIKMNKFEEVFILLDGRKWNREVK